MGQAGSALSSDIFSLLTSLLSSDKLLRGQLLASLRQLVSDAQISGEEAKDWMCDKIIADFTNTDDSQVSTASSATRAQNFLSSISSLNQQYHLTAAQVNECLRRAAERLYDELKLDLQLHDRLLEIARDGSIARLKKIQQYICVDYANEYGCTALMMAAHMGRNDMAAHLLDLGADVNLADKYGWTALMHAARNGSTEIATSLIGAGANVAPINRNHCTALMCAADAGHAAIVAKLVIHGAALDVQSRSGDTALIRAVSNGHLGTAELLLEHGADVRKTGKGKRTAVMCAARGGHHQMVSALVECGADISGVDDEGKSVCTFETEGKMADAIQKGFDKRMEAMRMEYQMRALASSSRSHHRHHQHSHLQPPESHLTSSAFASNATAALHSSSAGPDSSSRLQTPSQPQSQMNRSRVRSARRSRRGHRSSRSSRRRRERSSGRQHSPLLSSSASRSPSLSGSLRSDDFSPRSPLYSSSLSASASVSPFSTPSTVQTNRKLQRGASSGSASTASLANDAIEEEEEKDREKDRETKSKHGSIEDGAQWDSEATDDSGVGTSLSKSSSSYAYSAPKSKLNGFVATYDDTQSLAPSEDAILEEQQNGVEKFVARLNARKQRNQRQEADEQRSQQLMQEDNANEDDEEQQPKKANNKQPGSQPSQSQYQQPRMSPSVLPVDPLPLNHLASSFHLASPSSAASKAVYDAAESSPNGIISPLAARLRKANSTTPSLAEDSAVEGRNKEKEVENDNEEKEEKEFSHVKDKEEDGDGESSVDADSVDADAIRAATAIALPLHLPKRPRHSLSAADSSELEKKSANKQTEQDDSSDLLPQHAQAAVPEATAKANNAQHQHQHQHYQSRRNSHRRSTDSRQHRSNTRKQVKAAGVHHSNSHSHRENSPLQKQEQQTHIQTADDIQQQAKALSATVAAVEEKTGEMPEKKEDEKDMLTEKKLFASAGGPSQHALPVTVARNTNVSPMPQINPFASDADFRQAATSSSVGFSGSALLASSPALSDPASGATVEDSDFDFLLSLPSLRSSLMSVSADSWLAQNNFASSIRTALSGFTLHDLLQLSYADSLDLLDDTETARYFCLKKREWAIERLTQQEKAAFEDKKAGRTPTKAEMNRGKEDSKASKTSNASDPGMVPVLQTPTPSAATASAPNSSTPPPQTVLSTVAVARPIRPIKPKSSATPTPTLLSPASVATEEVSSTAFVSHVPSSSISSSVYSPLLASSFSFASATPSSGSNTVVATSSVSSAAETAQGLADRFFSKLKDSVNNLSISSVYDDYQISFT